MGKPGMQTVPQLDIEHTGVPFGSVGQTLPHPLQFPGSEVGSTQADPHLMKGAAQVKSHLAPLHVAVPWSGTGQAVPQPLQFSGSFCSSTHVWPHEIANKPIDEIHDGDIAHLVDALRKKKRVDGNDRLSAAGSIWSWPGSAPCSKLLSAGRMGQGTLCSSMTR